MTRAFPRISLLLAAAALVLTACTTPPTDGSEDDYDKTRRGALLGAGIGAAIGVITGDDKEERRRNAMKGAILGAGGGALIGSQLDKQEADLRRDLGSDEIRITNTGDRLIVTMPQDLLFATDSAELRADLQRDLRALAGNLQAYPNSTVQVIGHTDNTGDAAYNDGLSRRRANTVAQVLIAEGVSSGRLQAIGRGESQPVADNLTADGRAQNRRVEIVILPNA